MSARLRKLGFRKSRMQMTRHGVSFEHPKASALFTFGKHPESSVMVTAPDNPEWSFAFLTADTWDRIQQNPWVVLPWEQPKDGSSILCATERFFSAGLAPSPPCSPSPVRSNQPPPSGGHNHERNNESYSHNS